MTQTALLEIKNLHVLADGKKILKGINLTIMPGEIHAIMGPNGSGKSTLSNVLVGNEAYEITKGALLYKGKDLRAMKPHERAAEGLFMSFQSPAELPGVTTMSFLKASLNAIRRYHNQEPYDAMEFLKLVRTEAARLGISDEMLRRGVNSGFSGGEKKRNELLQMALLNPELSILDEIDSGLDIDALNLISEGVNRLHNQNKGILMITHYQRLLKKIKPDVIHILADGIIQKSGGEEIALELEKEGYKNYITKTKMAG